MFRHPYDSGEIGFFTVSIIDFHPFVCEPNEVHSKCGILSNAEKFGSPNEPHAEIIDPLPESVLNELNSKETTNQSVRAAYRRAFPEGVPTWTLFSLLIPGRDS